MATPQQERPGEGMTGESASGHRHFDVVDRDGIRSLHFERNRQSSMRLDDPFATDIEYVGYLHLALAVAPHCARVLVIGLGGGSIVKQMWHDYPWMRIDVAEIDSAMVDVAHELFDVPRDERIRIFTEDGRRFVNSAADLYDAIVIDAFDDDRIPPHLLTKEFLRECRARLAPDGAVVYNLIGAIWGPQSKAVRSVFKTVSSVWRHVWLFPVGMWRSRRDAMRNIVLVASDAELATDELLARIATRVGGVVTVHDFERFGDDLYRAKVRTHDVPILRDHDLDTPGKRVRGHGHRRKASI